jgi:multiple sugar transport system ATP-binding protein
VTHDQTEAMTMGDRVAVIKKGLLQQVDAPQVLYDRPRNLFVAGFIGSPAMNMVEADLTREDGSLFVTFGGSKLRVDDGAASQRPALRAFEGGRVILGIRPENMEDASIVSDASSDRRLTVQVTLREALGSEILIHFPVDAPPVMTDDTRELFRDTGALDDLEGRAEAGASTFVARLDPRSGVAERERLELYVDTARLHFFDPRTGAGIYEEPVRS